MNMRQNSFFWVLLFLSGCMVESVPPMNYYTLNYHVGANGQPGNSACLKAGKVLKITSMGALSPYNSQSIIYSETPNDLNSYL